MKCFSNCSDILPGPGLVCEETFHAYILVQLGDLSYMRIMIYAERTFFGLRIYANKLCVRLPQLFLSTLSLD